VLQVAELDTLQTELDESVTREDYRAAAALKAQQDRLIDQDCLGAALLALDKAVAEQRFAGAGPSQGRVLLPLHSGSCRVLLLLSSHGVALYFCTATAGCSGISLAYAR
jgi:hypothetical protein